MIHYGIGFNYLPDWGFPEALREIYQNFYDSGAFEEEIIMESPVFYKIQLTNNWKPANSTFLKIGESGKRGDSSSIGEHGEGLKMAMMVLQRDGFPITISWNKHSFTTTSYIDDHLGKCFGLETLNNEEQIENKFVLTYKIPKKTYMEFKKSVIKPADVIFEHDYGQIIDKSPGEIYIGGLFVTKLSNMNRAYNFKPEYIKLDRDRKVPKSFDVEYYASKILASWEGTNIDDIVSRDGSYIHHIPNKISKKFTPDIAGDTIVFSSGDKVAPQNIKDLLMKIPSNIKKVQKLKYRMSNKRKPLSILKEYFDKHPVYDVEHKIEMDMLLKQAKDWK